MSSCQVSRRALLRRVRTYSATAMVAPALLGLAGGLGSADAVADFDPQSLAFLQDLTAATINAARVPPGEKRGGQGSNTTGIAIVTPGGNYPALWVRDFAMSLGCGLIRPDDMLSHLRLIARCQNGAQERRLKSGGIIPAFAIPDHIDLAGRAVFYPGTYSSGEDQGADPWGPLPPGDDHYYFVDIAHTLWRTTRKAGFLSEPIDGVQLLDRLLRAFDAPISDPTSGAAVSRKSRRAVGFGFQDTVYLLGAMCFATLLRWRAARQLAEMCAAVGHHDRSTTLAASARRISEHLIELFVDPAHTSGWLRAATEVGKQPDVWATLFALHLGVLPPDVDRRARQTVAAAIRDPKHPIEYEGAVRHVPADHDFSPTSAWEKCVAAHGTYQNGAYWHTPTGWLIEALKPIAPDLARDVFDRYVRHLRDNDFRKGNGRGAPWECFGLDLKGAQNPVYMASAALPLAVVQRLGG